MERTGGGHPQTAGAADPGLPVIRADRNENPLGPPPAALERVAAALGALHRYPETDLAAATAAVAAIWDVSERNVLLTHGVDEATDLLLLHERAAWGLRPGFDGYWQRADALALPFRSVELDDRWRPTTPPAAFARGGAVLVANPNNPTGLLAPDEWLEGVASSAVLLCVDETYLDVAAAGTESMVSRAVDDDRVCVFVSFSKAYGLAGMRVGALLGAPPLIDRLRRRQPYRSVDGLALAAVLGCLDDPGHRVRARDHVLEWRPRLVATLRAADRRFADVRDTEASFVLARPRGDARHERAELAAQGLRTHECSPNGLPGWLRVSVGTAEEVERIGALVAAPG